MIADRRRPQACQPREGDTDVEVITDEVGVVKEYAIMARDNYQFAKFNKIGIDRAGDPNPNDLHLAWAAGARAFRFTPT